MKNICNHCGQVIPDGAKVCPNCGTPAANVSHDEKKIWERDDLKPAQEPDVLDTQESLGSGITPPPFHEAEKRRRRKFFWVAITLGAIAVVLIIIMLIAWLASHSSVHYSHYTTREHTTVTHTPNGTITVTTSGNMSDAQADSMMQAAMAEMQQTDSAMQAMMNSMMGGADPFASEIEGEMPSRHMAQQHHASTSTMPTLAGHIGKREFVMVLNLKDPQNVKGSGSYVANGKEQGKLHLLGIQDGEALTVSIYGKGNKLQGTLSGSYDGIQYQGSYQVDGKETPFDLYVR